MNDTLHLWASSFPSLLGATIAVTIPLSLISFALALIVGAVTAQWRVARSAVLRGISWFYVWFFRGTPLLVQLFIVFYGLPSVGLTLNAWTAGIITLALNSGAYCAEGIRAAESSIPAGQWEAARSLHMTRAQTLRHVIAPQTIRITLPPLSNEFINVVKSTSLVSTITLSDLMQVGQRITAVTFAPMPIYIEVAVIYLAIVSLLSLLQSKLEKRASRYVVGRTA